MTLNLDRPIVFFDLETTGVNVGRDHIIQISMLRVNPNGVNRTKTEFIRPADENGVTIHIPEESTLIHGITDADVADKPTFKEKAMEIAEFRGDSDLAGYNSNKFDVPMLVEEFMRAKCQFSLNKRFLVDVQNIFHKMEPRTLKAAYRFYCGKELENAHSADADTMATYEVLLAQLERYKDVEYVDSDGKVSKPIVNDIDELSKFTTVLRWADLVGHIGYNAQNRKVFNFGKHKGRVVEEVFQEEPSYYDWMMKADFPLSTKECITKSWRYLRDKKKLDALKAHFSSQI